MMKTTKTFVKLLCALLAVCLCFAGCSAPAAPDDAAAGDLENIQAKGTLVVGVTDYAPMDYQLEDGSWAGFDADFARAIAEKLGVEAQFIEIEWNNRFYELSSGAIDCIWNGMTITEEALANASVTDAYVVNAQVVVMSADRLADYADADSLAGLAFAVEAGSAGEEALADIGIAENVTALLTQADALMEVAAGAADACVIDITMANAMTGAGTSYAGLGYALALTSEEYGIAFRTGSDVTAVVNDLIAQMRADGSLQALADAYQLTLAGA